MLAVVKTGGVFSPRLAGQFCALHIGCIIACLLCCGGTLVAAFSRLLLANLFYFCLTRFLVVQQRIGHTTVTILGRTGFHLAGHWEGVSRSQIAARVARVAHVDRVLGRHARHARGRREEQSRRQAKEPNTNHPADG